VFKRVMLGTLRKGAHSFFAKILMGVLIVSFAAWGIGDILRSSGGQPTIATVGEEAITVAEFQAEMQYLRRSFGENYTPEIIKNLNLYSTKLSEMINRSMIQQEVKRLGITVSDDELIVALSKDPNFINANGAFDKPLFLRTLQQMGISEKTYLDSMRKEMAVRILLSTFSMHSLVNPRLVQAVYASQHEKRKVELIRIDHTPHDTEMPGDEELQKFYEAHKTNYTAPEYRTFSYVVITPEEVLKDVQISRQDLFDYYTQRTSEFSLPQQREIEQLLYPEKAGAEQAYSMLRSGAPVAEVVRQVPPKGGKLTPLGLKTEDAMPTGGKEIFALDTGEFTTPIKSPFGWHIFIVTSIHPESTAPFDTVKDELKTELTNQRANTLLSELLEQFEDALSAGQPLQEAAKSVNLSFVTTDPVDRFGKRSDNSSALDAKENDDLLSAGFSLQQGERSELTTRPDGSYFIVQLDNITAPRERAYEEVRGQVEADVKSRVERHALEEYAKNAADRLKAQTSEADRAAALASLSNAPRPSVLVERNGAAQKQAGQEIEALLTPELLTQIYALKTPGDSTGAVASPKGYVIALLKEVVPAPSPDSTEEGRRLFKAVKRSLREDYQNEILEQYLHYLQSQYPVSINEAAIQSIMSQ